MNKTNINNRLRLIVIAIILLLVVSLIPIAASEKDNHTKLSPEEKKETSLVLNNLKNNINQLNTQINHFVRQNDDIINSVNKQKSSINTSINEMIENMDDELHFSDHPVCKLGANRKTFMDYRTINKNSRQYQLISTLTKPNDEGLLVTEDGFIAVALGAKYEDLGTKYRVTTDEGKVFKVIKVEAKAPQDTTNDCVDRSGAMIEFVIDSTIMRHDVKLHGNYDVDNKFSGSVIKMEKYQ